VTEQQAGDLAAEQGLKVRVAGRDGECYVVDMSYSKGRVNLYLENGLVVWAAIF
jgi:hypothetical protein